MLFFLLLFEPMKTVDCKVFHPHHCVGPERGKLLSEVNTDRKSRLVIRSASPLSFPPFASLSFISPPTPPLSPSLPPPSPSASPPFPSSLLSLPPLRPSLPLNPSDSHLRKFSPATLLVMLDTFYHLSFLCHYSPRSQSLSAAAVLFSPPILPYFVFFHLIFSLVYLFFYLPHSLIQLTFFVSSSTSLSCLFSVLYIEGTP